jgi:tRNA threonylcarbamoyladenosine biosynthesis protein TsaE
MQDSRIHSLSCARIEDLNSVAREILNLAPEIRVWLLKGDLGAGKTALIKEICKNLGVDEQVSSPTFSLINEYQDSSENAIFHFDFYRLGNKNQIIDLGFTEYLDSGDYCFVEWPELIEDLVDRPFGNIQITVKENEERDIIVSTYE